MGTTFAIAFVASTAGMVTTALILGFQQWREDRRHTPIAPAE